MKYPLKVKTQDAPGGFVVIDAKGKEVAGPFPEKWEAWEYIALDYLDTLKAVTK